MARQNDDPGGRPVHELYFATVRAIGSNIDDAVTQLRHSLGRAGYHLETIVLSKLFGQDSLTRDHIKAIPGTASEFERRNTFMDAGDRLRTEYGEAAVAQLALREFHRQREKVLKRARQENRRGVAWLFRSLMHETEVDFLRSLLAPEFFVLSFFSNEDRRRDALVESLQAQPGNPHLARSKSRPWSDFAEDLLRRDQGHDFRLHDDTLKHLGDIKRLSIEKTFQEADAFFDLDRLDLAKRQIDRFVRLIFSYPYATTTLDESAMAHAYDAMRESAAIARRVGASIVVDDMVVATGRNDIPRAGGGQFRHPATGDAVQEMSREPKASKSEREDIYRDVITRLLKDPVAREAIYLPSTVPSDNQFVDQCVTELLKLNSATGSRVFGLLEFNPTVHAEMSAICAAARRGTALDTGHLYTTTFPCHECTRHIIATGIRRVVYVEPFPKSRAEKLFENQIRLGAKHDHASGTSDLRVAYEPFMGIAPRRQADLFSSVKRSDKPTEIEGWTLDDTKELRPSIVPKLEDERARLRSEARMAEQQDAIKRFERRARATRRAIALRPSPV